MRRHRLVAVVLSLWSALASGQGPIYESQGRSGPVFSDRPSPGAKEVALPPPNVIAHDRVAPAQATAQPAPADQPPVYRSLAISSPADGDTIHTNTGAFDVQVAVVPALRDGDRIELKLDGTVLQRAFRSGSLSVTEADWQSVAAENVEHTLQVAVVSGDGKALIESPVVRFYAHRATVRRQRR